jgi:replicative DNA helicase
MHEDTNISLPQSHAAPEAEMGLLASMMIDPNIIPQIDLQIGKRRVFADELYQMAYDAMVHLSRDQSAIDAPLLLGRLREMGAMETFPDTVPRLEAALRSSASAVNWSYYLSQVSRAHMRRELEMTAHVIVHQCRTNPDTDDVFAKAHDLMGAVGSVESTRGDVGAADGARLMFDMMSKGKSCYATGIQSFDDVFGGIPIPGVTTIIARPNQGKTTLALQVAAHIATTAQVRPRVFSYEQPADRVMATVLGNRTGVPLHNYRLWNQKLTDAEMAKVSAEVQRLDRAGWAMVEEPLDVDSIYKRCERYRRQGVKLIIVDYLQNLPAPQGLEAGTMSMQHNCQRLQAISRTLGLGVIMVSQPTLQSSREDRPLTTRDGQGAGAIDQVTDMGISIYRPALDGSAFEAERWPVTLHVTKNKYGPLGQVEVEFNGRLTRFE